MLQAEDPKIYKTSASRANKLSEEARILHEKQDIPYKDGIVCCIGGAHSGKNQKISEQLLYAGVKSDNGELPMVSIIYDNDDVVTSLSKIKAALPEEEQYLVQDVVLNNTLESAINPLDTQVGFDSPTNMGRWQTINTLMRLLTPLEKQVTNESLGKIITFLVKKSYQLTHVDANEADKIVKMYQKGYHQELDDVLASMAGKFDILGLDETIEASELACRLHIAGEGETGSVREQLWRGRDLAHKQAMPVLADLVTILDTMNDYISTTYNSVQPDTGEPTVKYVRRALIDAINDYPCFAHITKLDTSKSRILAIDLREVMRGNDPRCTNTFIQIAHKIATDKSCLLGADVEQYESLFSDEDKVDVYAGYKIEQLKQLNSVRRKLVLALDGMKFDDFNEMIAVLGREKRKYGLGYTVSANRLTDLAGRYERFDVLAYTVALNVFSKLDHDDYLIFEGFFASNDEIKADFDRIDNSHYFSYLYQPFGCDSFVKTALCKKEPFLTSLKSAIIAEREKPDSSAV